MQRDHIEDLRKSYTDTQRLGSSPFGEDEEEVGRCS
jgi:hypothetical protein